MVKSLIDNNKGVPVMALKIIGHRGNGRTIDTTYNQDQPYEHTLESFRQAMEDGADGVEFDIFTTKDKHPVIYCKDDLGGHAISAQTLAQVKQHKLPDGQTVPTLREALDLFSTFPDDFVYNVELKGSSVVEPSLDVLSEYVDAGAFEWSQFLFSSFDWDKLGLVKELAPEAHIQPTTATVFIFNQEDVKMPGYTVPLHKTYNAQALKGLSRYVRQHNAHAIDLPTLDIRPELLDIARKLGTGFCTHPTGPRLEQDILRLTDQFNLLKDFADETGLPVYLKLDNIKLAREILEKRIPNPSATQLSILSGAPHIPDLKKTLS